MKLIIFIIMFNILFANENIHLTIESETHNNAIRSILLDKNKDLITISEDKTIKVWDSKNNKLKSTIYGQIDIGYVGRLNHAAYNEKINNLAVSGDFAQNQENYEMYKIRIYDMNSNKIYKTIENKNGIVSNLEFSSDGKFLVTGFTSPIYHFSIYETSSYKIVDDIKIVERYLPKRYHHFKLKIIQKKDDYLIITVSELGDIDIYSKKTKEIYSIFKY